MGVDGIGVKVKVFRQTTAPVNCAVRKMKTTNLNGVPRSMVALDIINPAIYCGNVSRRQSRVCIIGKEWASSAGGGAIQRF